MESNDKSKIQKKRMKEELMVPLIILAFLACAWLVYLHENRAWAIAFEQVMSWIGNPTITYTPVQIEGLLLAFLATIEVIILGVLSSHLLLSREKSPVMKFISALGLGFGLTGVLTVFLGIFGNLYRLHLNVAILLLCIGFLSVILYKQRGKEKLSVKKFLANSFPLRKIAKLPALKFWSLAYLAIGIIFFFCFYHALLTIIVHWDATVYHAVMAAIMYDNNGIPLIAGPSIGIQMSANFPPLFSAIGSYYYIQIGAVEDLFLRIIPPIMGVLTVMATFKIGENLAGKKYGLISALVLAMTPLFFRYSFYATSYSTLAFFCTTSILFLILAIREGGIKYWTACGLFYGFALLTAYIALYLVPFFVMALIFYFIRRKSDFTVKLKKASALILSTLLIGSIWYLRNWTLVGNPIYPNAYTLLGGINIDPLIMETTFGGLKWSGTNAFFGSETTILGKIFMFLTYRTHFPAISLFTILGLALIPYQNKKLWLVSIWPFTVSILVLSGLTWAFPRHIVLALPGFALLSALPILKAFEKCEEYDTHSRRESGNIAVRLKKRLHLEKSSDVIKIGFALLLFAAFLFPSLTFSFMGKVSMDNQHDPPPDDCIWLFKNPNGEKWAVITYIIPEGIGWKWLDEHLKEGEKVAAVENRIYQVKNSSNDYFFYLDGWEARQLYNITDPAIMLQFLKTENVKYILDVAWARTHGHFDILPMTKFLGSPYFPKIVDCKGNPDIFNVGPIESPITINSSTLVYINKDGWSKPQLVDGVYAQSVIAGNVSSRLYVATPNLTSVRITYHDLGTDGLSINLKNPYSDDWIYGYATIKKEDTGAWKTFEFLAPLIGEGFAELALHAYTENFSISRIEAAPFQSPGKVTLSSLENETTNATVPPTLMVYLPMLRDNATVLLKTNSFGKKICIEVFEGVIQPWETTEWWKRHPLAVRSPNSIFGQVDPSLVFNARESGLYTLIIVPKEKDWEITKVDLQASIGFGFTYETDDNGT
jgi:4-amino-4-deoxy-L-arabinose transferase-like glycosyltransferase